jgi:hypothetical protein
MILRSEGVRGVMVWVAPMLMASGCAAPPHRADGPAGGVPVFETFIVADGYRGPLLTIYSQPGGASPSWKADTAVYPMPSNGILRIVGAEPPNSTKTAYVFASRPTEWIGNYPTCADMRVNVHDTKPQVCWLDYSIGGTGVPGHTVAILTDWAGIPANFNRTTFVYDSVLFNGKGRGRQIWTEPKDIEKRRPPPKDGA